MSKRALTLAAAAAVLTFGFTRYGTASASDFPTFPACHDDSSMVKQVDKQGGGPSDLQGSESGDHGYYYLTITAGCGQPAGTPVTLVVQVHLIAVLSGQVDSDGMCWSLHVDLGYDHNPLAASLPMGNDVSLTYSGAVAGQKYRIRIANLEPGVTVDEHSSVDG